MTITPRTRLNDPRIRPEGAAALAALLAFLDRPEESWRLDAACVGVDPDLWFPDGGTAREAVKICRTCPVQIQCLDAALTRGEKYGVWGGVGERSRKDIATRRRRAMQ